MATSIALAFCVIVYIIFSFLAYISYGDTIQSSIFENIKNENNIASFLIRVMFLIIFICNIVFVFFFAKECFLVLIEEIRYGSVSVTIMRKLDQAKNGSLLENYEKEKTDDSKDF
jgi:hypothetical protein